MARAVNRLSAAFVKSVIERGMYPDGLGLYLQVVNRELNDAEHKLDELCTAIGETATASEERAEQMSGSS